MGFDVYGKNPKNSKGEYFRASIWQWRPLWEFCEEIDPRITSKVKNPFMNDGDGLNDEDAQKLAHSIDLSLLTSTPMEREQEFRDRLEQYPLVPCPLEMPNEHDNCFVCGGTNEYRDVPFEKTAELKPFYVDMLKEFMWFCRNSGGFEIW